MAGNGFDTLGARFGLKGIEISSREKGKALKPVCCQIPKAFGETGIELTTLNQCARCSHLVPYTTISLPTKTSIPLKKNFDR